MPPAARLRPELGAPRRAELAGLTGVRVFFPQSRGAAPGLPAGASASPAGRLPHTGRHGGIRAPLPPALPSSCFRAPPRGPLGHQPPFTTRVSFQIRRGWSGPGGAGDAAPSCPGPALPLARLTGVRFPPLQKVRSYGGDLLSAGEFQKLFNEFDKRVIKEVTGARPRGVSGEGCRTCWLRSLG